MRARFVQRIIALLLGVEMRPRGTCDVLDVTYWPRGWLDVGGGIVLAPARRRDAAGRAWRIRLLGREGVRDDRVAAAGVAARVLAAALGAGELVLRACILLAVGVLSDRRWVVRLRAVVGVRGRERHRRVLGVHCRRVGAKAAERRASTAGNGPGGLAKSTRRRACYSGGRDCLRRGKTLVTYDLRSQGLGTWSWAWLLPSRERAKARHRLGPLVKPPPAANRGWP
jgi:hypothetical protein